MKHQQVIVDYTVMLKSSITCIFLIFAVWMLIKLVQAAFLLPKHLQKQQEELYEKLIKQGNAMCKSGDILSEIQQCDEEEAAAAAEAEGSPIVENNDIDKVPEPLEVKKVN